MRRFRSVLALTLLLTILTFSGCRAADDSMQQALRMRTALLTAGSCTFQADISASYDDVRYDFSLDCTCDTDGAATMTVTAPQTLAGIAASIQGTQADVTYDDTSIAFGLLAGGHLAPMQLPQLLTQALAGDYIRAAGSDHDTLRVTYLHGYDDEELTVDVWFSAACLPQYAEVTYDGQTLLTAAITNFVLADATS